MSNTITLTNLAPEIYKAADIVARELAGAIPSVMVNTADANGVTQASFGDKVKSLRTSDAVIGTSHTPAMAIPEAADQTDIYDEFALDQTATAELPLTGETVKRLNQSSGAEAFRVAKFTQMIRGMVNAMESHLCSKIYVASSRAYGTAGTTPFGSNFNDLAQLRKILADNGAPVNSGELSVVMNTSAGANLRSLAQLQKANEAAGTDLLRRGTLLDLQGFMLKESAGIVTHTKGTATLFDAAGGEPAGETSIAFDGATAGATGILAGDIVTWTGDTNKYVIKTGVNGATGTIVLGRPGLQQALSDTVEGTIGASYTANLAFHRSAVEFAARAPAQPDGGDAAKDSLTVVDPLTGLTFEFRLYAGFGMNKIYCAVYYGAKVWKEEFVATLLG